MTASQTESAQLAERLLEAVIAGDLKELTEIQLEASNEQKSINNLTNKLMSKRSLLCDAQEIKNQSKSSQITTWLLDQGFDPKVVDSKYG
jgi:hypothetical protein